MVYLDTSALVKNYVQEPHAEVVRQLVSGERLLATSTITRAEVAAAFSKAIRTGSLTRYAADRCLKVFHEDWKHYIRIRVTEAVVARADNLACTFRLRGYDAVHLASAMEWQERLGEAGVLATFDLELWQAVGEAGLECFPDTL
jgi:predicted nucleic acid-binding protein